MEEPIELNQELQAEGDDGLEEDEEENKDFEVTELPCVNCGSRNLLIVSVQRTNKTDWNLITKCLNQPCGALTKFNLNALDGENKLQPQSYKGYLG